jgi:hypothetical protein
MSQQIQITGGAKVRDLQDVIIGTSGVLSSVAFDVANGVPRLDVNGKILVSQLPNSVMEYKGVWNAATNTPTLVNGTGNQGDVYLCNVAGTVDFGAGPIVFFVGDQVIYSGTIWQRASGATGSVTSVAVTESGDSLNITGSPITTSGTINIGFNGTNLQYVNGAGNLTTFPDLTGFVPYTGATTNLDLGINFITSSAIKVIGDNSTYGGTLSIKQSNVTNLIGVGYTELFGKTNRLGISFGAGSIALLSNSILTAERTYTFPDATGTIALTSDIPILTGYVPYTGATANVDLGTFNLTADVITGATGSFASSGGSNTFAINHSSGAGIALNITKGGNGEGLYINKTSGSGNAATIIGTLNATTLVKSGGTSSQFLKADGTVDSSTYALDSAVVHNTGNETVGGTKTFSDATKNNGGIFLQNASSNSLAGYMNLGGLTNGVKFTSGGGISNTFTLPSATGYTFTFPNATGTIALTSDLTGGTVTSVAALTIGTSGTDLSSSVANSTTTPVITLNVPTASATNRGALSSADWTTFNNKQSALTNPVLASGTWTSGYLPKINGTYTIGNSLVYDDGTGVGIGTIVPLQKFDVTTTAGEVISSTSNRSTNGQYISGIVSSAKNSSAAYLSYAATYGLIESNTAASESGAYTIWTRKSGTLSEKLRLDASGNLGLGVTPSAWSLAGLTAMQIKNAGFFGYLNNLYASANAYYNAGWKYIANANAAYYSQNEAGAGIHAWYNAPSGTADAAITWTQAMTLFSDGNLLLTNSTVTNAGYKLDVNGTGRFSSTFYANSNAYIGTSGGTNFIALSGNASTTGSFILTGPSGTIISEIEAQPLTFRTSNLDRLTIASTGAATFGNTLTIGGTTNMSGTDVTSVYTDARVQSAVTGTMIGYGVRMVALSPSSGSYTVANMYAIKTSTPVVQPNVTVTNSYGIYIGRTDDPSSGGVVTNRYALVTEANAGNVLIGTTTDAGYKLDVNGTGRFSGNVTIGAAAAATNRQLIINGVVNKAGRIHFQESGVDKWLIGNGAANETGNFEIYASSGAGIFEINKTTFAATFSSSVTATGFFESSDSRLKTLIQDNYQIKGIASVTPKLYTKNGKVELGYYAQDLVGILDSAVSKGSDDMLSLSYREVLVAKVYALEQEIKELKGRKFNISTTKLK